MCLIIILLIVLNLVPLDVYSFSYQTREFVSAYSSFPHHLNDNSSVYKIIPPQQRPTLMKLLFYYRFNFFGNNLTLAEEILRNYTHHGYTARLYSLTLLHSR